MSQVSKLLSADEAYQAAVRDFSAAVAAALGAVNRKEIAPADFESYMLEQLSCSFGERLQRGELQDPEVIYRREGSKR